MAVNEQVISIIEQAVGSEAKRQGHQGDHGFSCPWCNHPESKKKLWVNFDPEAEAYQNFQCWVCGESGKSLFTLLKKINAPKRLFKRLKKFVDAPSSSYSRDEDEEDFSISLPENFRLLSKSQSGIVFRHAINRLKKRGLSKGDVIKHQIGYCKRGKYNRRIIVPSYNREGELNYFVARSIWSDQFPKYKNPSAPRNQIVPFGSMVNWREPVTIVEGPFDAIAVRRNAIPLLGNNLPESLAKKLIEAPTSQINMALDADMKEVALQIAEKFMSEDFEIRLIELPEGKDPGDLGFEEMSRRIKSAESLGYSELVSRKLWT